MRFRILGPVEVVADGQPLDIGPRQRRAVLAALLVDAGTPVPIATLADRVWGPAAPEAPRSALYAHVARLRRVIGEAGDRHGVPVSLGRQGDGYVLDVDRELVDLHRFQVLVDASRAARVSGNERVTMLREAMSLWRGAPLSTVSSDWADRVRRSVESRFIGAAAAWAAEELQLGNAAVVVDRLAELVSAYPLAEQLVALLMRALCALGRKAEALQCFADTRARLVEQLGVEPGPELGGVHLAVLRGELDDRLGEPDAGWGQHRQVPRQLPADVSRFIGRSAELRYVDRWLRLAGGRGAATVMTVYGAAGVGKSALAVHTAHRMAERYPDGQLYLDLRGFSVGLPPLEPAEALARLLRTLGIAAEDVPAQVDEAAALFRSLVVGRRLLLVLDNVADARQVEPLLPGGTSCATLVTSRQPLVGVGDSGRVGLGSLELGEAVELLGQWAGPARVAAEPEAAAAIAGWCECLPLALCVAGARLAARPRWPLAELCDRLADERRRLDNLEFGGLGFRSSLAGSYHRLSASPDLGERAAAEAFTLLGASGTAELDTSMAARLLALSETEAEWMLERLVDAQLLHTSAPGSYRMGDLLRLYAQEQRAAGGQDCPRAGGEAWPHPAVAGYLRDGQWLGNGSAVGRR